MRGWALALQGQGEEGLAQVHQGLAAVKAIGTALFVPYSCALLADVADHLGHPEDGLQALTEAHTLVEQQENRWWEAEVCRLRGVLLLRQSGRTSQAEAETWLQRALDVARRQEAKSLELRAAMSLSRLWQQQGKRQEAHDLLSEVYAWFTRDLTLPISRTPKRCWIPWRDTYRVSRTPMACTHVDADGLVAFLRLSFWRDEPFEVCDQLRDVFVEDLPENI
jgi:hypothetical protein